MADTIKVKMTGFTGEHAPGDELDLEPAVARAYVRNGVARYATVPDAKAAGAPREAAATITPEPTGD